MKNNKKWWSKNAYQWYRKEYQKSANKYLWGLGIAVLLLVIGVFVSSTSVKTAIYFFGAMVAIVSITVMYVLRSVDEHEKKLNQEAEKRKNGG